MSVLFIRTEREAEERSFWLLVSLHPKIHLWQNLPALPWTQKVVGSKFFCSFTPFYSLSWLKCKAGNALRRWTLCIQQDMALGQIPRQNIFHPCSLKFLLSYYEVHYKRDLELDSRAGVESSSVSVVCWITEIILHQYIGNGDVYNLERRDWGPLEQCRHGILSVNIYQGFTFPRSSITEGWLDLLAAYCCLSWG